MKHITPILGLLLSFAACKSATDTADASGVFEANEVIISAEATGVLRQFGIAEGQQLQANQQIGSIDCTQLDLQVQQVTASQQALNLRRTDAGPQVQVIEAQIPVQESQIAAQKEQLATLETEQQRLQRLVAAKAAPAKQLDDINGQVSVLKKQLAAAQAQLQVLRQQSKAQKETADIANRGITSEHNPLEARKAQLHDQRSKCTVLNPVKGTVLSKYMEQYEMAVAGKPMYKIANLDTLVLRAYFTGDQLAQVKLGKQVQVLLRQGDIDTKTLSGTVSWVSEQAEFTPKTIQTVDERANLVYAVKIAVPNPQGEAKIGMYADVKLVE